MPDLESLLRGYADQLATGPTPPLVTVQRSRRRRLGLRVASAVVAVGVAGVLGVTWVGDRARHVTPTDGVAAQLVIDGVRLDRTVSTDIVEVQARSATSTTLTVEAGTQNFHPPSQCSPWTDARVLSETHSTITLAATLYVDRAPLPAGNGCAVPGYPPQRFTLALREPLGRRTVVQSGSSLPVLLLNTLLLPTALPAGYPDTPMTNAGFGTAGHGGSLTRYRGPVAGSYLEVLQVPLGVLRSFGGHTVGHTVVRGHGAAIVQNGSGKSYDRCLRWDETAATSMQVCSQGSPAPFTVAQLRSVAQSLATGPP